MDDLNDKDWKVIEVAGVVCFLLLSGCCLWPAVVSFALQKLLGG